ncbi:MAG: aromatic amino acid lyase [Frankia sp.]
MIEIDGSSLGIDDIVAVARRRTPVRVGEEARERVRRSQVFANAASSERPVYGRTTGVGANRVLTVADPELGARGLILSHATSGGSLRSAERVRAMLVVRLNQLAADGNGASPDLLDALADLLQLDALPPVRELGSIGTGDLSALAVTALAISGQVETTNPIRRPVVVGSGDALPFLSSNAATLADAALALADLVELAEATHVVAALTFAGVTGNIEAFAPAVEVVTPFPGARQVCVRMRELVAGAPTGARIQDPFGLRSLPQVQGVFLDSLAILAGVVTPMVNTGSENPIVSATHGVAHHGGFHASYLAQSLDAVVLAASQSAHLSLARLTMLAEPAYTGLAPFLGDGTPAASGIMILKYVVASALAEMRTLASPASLQSVTLSRGVEEDASFASLAASQAAQTAIRLRTVLAGELVAAVRCLRLRARPGAARATLPAGLDAALATLPAGLHAAWAAVGNLPGNVEDRDLTADLEMAERLLNRLAGTDPEG